MSSSTINGTLVTAPSASTATTIPRPRRTRRKRLLTLADAVDHVLRVLDINPGQTRAVERAVQAVQSAKNTFPSYSTQGFRYYQGKTHVTFNATIDLGEVTVASNVVTPTVAPTFPDWIDLAQIRVDQKTYLVYGYTTGTSLIVDGLPDGTYQSVELQQGFARLPKDFRRRGSVTDGNRTYPVVDVPAGILQSWEDYYEWANSAANPIMFGAVTGDQRFQGELMLAVWPPYTTQKVLSVYYERYMSELDYHRVGTGTVTTVGTAITTTDSVFTSEHIGCAIMFSTGAAAEFQQPLASQDLIAGQRIITDVDSDTGATMDVALDTDVAGKSFYITDVVDVLCGPSEEAFLSLCEWELVKNTKTRSGEVAGKFKEFRQQLELALADDARYRDSVDDTPYVSWGYGIGEVSGRPDL